MRSKKTQRIIWGVLIWSVFLLLPLLNLPLAVILQKQSSFQLRNQLLLGLLSIGFYYFNYHLAIPRFYLKKRYWLYGGILLLSVLLILATLSGLRLLFGPEEFAEPRERLVLLSNFTMRFLLLFMASFGISFYRRYQQAETAKVKAELKALKHQINPHFLFNTLNDLYGQAITQSDGLAENIARLSSIMRYVLTDAKIEKVALYKEIEYLKSYIELQERRLTEKTQISFTVEGNTDQKTIPPLLLINFIENAFKHGVSTEQESQIDIQIQVEGDLLRMIVANDIPVRPQEVHSTPQTGMENSPQNLNSHHIGLENTRQRLDLMYPGQYRLEILRHQEKHLVKLEMQLS